MKVVHAPPLGGPRVVDRRRAFKAGRPHLWPQPVAKALSSNSSDLGNHVVWAAEGQAQANMKPVSPI